MVVTVSDNGVGVPDGFDLEQATGLGLSIVRALVVSDLRGSIELSDPVDGEGAVITIRVPLSSFAF